MFFKGLLMTFGHYYSYQKNILECPPSFSQLISAQIFTGPPGGATCTDRELFLRVESTDVADSGQCYSTVMQNEVTAHTESGKGKRQCFCPVPDIIIILPCDSLT